MTLPSPSSREPGKAGASHATMRYIELVFGTKADYSAAVRKELQQRWRVLCLLMVVMLAASLCWLVFMPQSTTNAAFLESAPALVDMLILAWACIELWRRTEMSLAQLRRLESVLVAAQLLYCATLQYVGMVKGRLFGGPAPAAITDGLRQAIWMVIPTQVLIVRGDIGLVMQSFAAVFPWVCFLFVSAVFFPTNLRRSIGLGILVVVCSLGSIAAASLSNWELHTSYLRIAALTGVLLIPLSALAAVAAHKFDTLERQNFEARQLGQYTLQRKLGAGGMGEVYLARHRLLRRPCAVKLIRPTAAGDPSNLVRFEREVQAMAALTHPNIVEVFDYGHTEDGTFYYAMEYLPGLSLDELVRLYGPLPPERIIYLLSQICDALSDAHAVDLIHRDIKPGNILVCELGTRYDVAKLLDFGLVQRVIPVGEAAAVADTEAENSEESPGSAAPAVETDALSVGVTQAGSLLGTPAYMSPEQARATGKLDLRTDIYSLGGVAYFLLTGRPPFMMRSILEAMAAHIAEPVQPPSVHRADLPSDLESVILRCLEKDPASRFPTAKSLAEALRRCACAGAWTQAAAESFWRSHRAAAPDADKRPPAQPDTADEQSTLPLKDPAASI